MREKHLSLHLPRARVVVIVEARFADCDAAGMERKRRERLNRDVRLLRGVVGMGADCEVDLRVRLGHRAVRLDSRHVSRDRHQAADTCRGGGGQHVGQSPGEIRKVEMAVGVDQHGINGHPAPGLPQALAHKAQSPRRVHPSIYPRATSRACLSGSVSRNCRAFSRWRCATGSSYSLGRTRGTVRQTLCAGSTSRQSRISCL